MKFFKNILPIIILFFANHSIAKSRSATASARPQPVAQSSFAKASADKQPVMQEKSYKDMVNFVKKTSNVWDSRDGRLNSEFIYTIIRKANQLNLDNDQLGSLLQTARDVHGIFSGNQNKDIAILNMIETQIKAAIDSRLNL